MRRQLAFERARRGRPPNPPPRMRTFQAMGARLPASSPAARRPFAAATGGAPTLARLAPRSLAQRRAPGRSSARLLAQEAGDDEPARAGASQQPRDVEQQRPDRFATTTGAHGARVAPQFERGRPRCRAPRDGGGRARRSTEAAPESHAEHRTPSRAARAAIASTPVPQPQSASAPPGVELEQELQAEPRGVVRAGPERLAGLITSRSRAAGALAPRRPRRAAGGTAGSRRPAGGTPSSAPPSRRAPRSSTRRRARRPPPRARPAAPGSSPGAP